jgi:SAM-dependent methyltransferase
MNSSPSTDEPNTVLHLRKRMQRFYETSETYKGLLDGHDAAYLQTFVEFVNRYAPSNAYILEVGCGNGVAPLLLSRMGHRVVGADISPLFLEEAQKWESDRLTYRVCDAFELPFEDETFDLVCSNELIEHVPDVERVLMEMIRVTRKGGRIIVSGPNLCSPLMPFMDFLRMLVGKPGRPIWAETKRQALENVVRNAALYFKKRLAKKPRFIYREPDLENRIIGGDADSAYCASPIDLEKFFQLHGLRILKLCAGFGPKGKIMAVCFPRISLYISMAVEK